MFEEIDFADYQEELVKISSSYTISQFKMTQRPSLAANKGTFADLSYASTTNIAHNELETLIMCSFFQIIEEFITRRYNEAYWHQ